MSRIEQTTMRGSVVRSAAVAGGAWMRAAGRLIALLCASTALLLLAPAGADAQATGCPPIEDKPGAIPHAEYEGMQELTYCVRAEVKPGANIIRLAGTNLFPDEPGYITRFDPELVYADGTVPRVDVLHLHHAVWVVNGNPQFATGEEKTIVQAPQGFGWRTLPTHNWLLNDMLHDLVAAPAEVYIVWRIDFVPDDAPGADEIRQVRTKWMDVARPGIYPVFDSLRGMGENGRYTFPDDATGDDRSRIGSNSTWTVNSPSTLIGTAGHLHPGGLNTQLRVTRGSTTRTLFTSRAHYFEPAGPVSWDVAMGGTTPWWRVEVQPGDKLSVHATYDVSEADWYEGMGIMPVMVYAGTGVGGQDALSTNIPQAEELTHGHLAENNHHGGAATGLPDPSLLPSAPAPSGPVEIDDFLYEPGDLTTSAVNPPTIRPGESLEFLSQDVGPAENAFHTITSCKAPCNRSTGIAYPIANGPVSFDSGQLGFNSPSPPYAGFGAPAADRDTWTAPDNLKQGTYNYFCRIHPFMRGSFRVAKPKCGGIRVELLGSAGKDKRMGTKQEDGIAGLSGRDKLVGKKGDDGLCGGRGKDKLMGGPGDDKLVGGAGKDTCRGGGGDDKLIDCER
jgi:RTX calcium-binding nonapeptide repeat (4 copies)